MTVFNSLGSNYDFDFVKSALNQIFFSNKNNLTKLSELLEKRYGGKSFLFHKGRDAIEFGLKVSLEPNSVVLTQAFSCYAVEEGIKRARMIPVYVDVDVDVGNGSNMNLETIKATYKENKDAKAVLLQHSLGIPVSNIDAIKSWCHTNNLVFIEDIAQAIGGTYSDGNPLGSKADLTIFSFGIDKIIDAVSGGAVVIKNLTDQQEKKIGQIELDYITKILFIKDMLYPIITFKIRMFHRIFLGKVIFRVARLMGLLSSPIVSPTKVLTKMHPGYAALALKQFSNLDHQLLHRREIAALYNSGITNKNVKKLASKVQLTHGSNLRFSIKVNNVANLLSYMKSNRVFISDRWYRTAVDCGSYKLESSYLNGSCKNAEELASKVVNFPTHINCSTDDARQIIYLINTFK